jgi:hypothetical protein
MGKSLFFILLDMVLTVSGCSPATKESGSSTAASTVPGGDTTAPPLTETSPLALKIYSKYDGVEFVSEHTFTTDGNAENGDGTTTCRATEDNPVVTCTIAVPEARLYFGSLNFNFSWDNSKCSLLTFRPYAYRASVSPAYYPPGETTPVDCLTDPSAVCWGGAATQLMAYPSWTALIYFPNEASLGVQSETATVPSAHSLHLGSNRLTVNDMPAAKTGNTYTSAQMGGAGDGYIANTYADYVFICRDHYYDPISYQINLFVTDVDSSAAPLIDDFFTWKELP